jgi:uncharacterized membrane protein YoaK (UPF0700 family)
VATTLESTEGLERHGQGWPSSFGRLARAQALSVPTFMVMVGMTMLVADRLEAIGIAPLRHLLLLQLLLLVGFLILCIAAGPHVEPDTTTGILAGMLGVSAMAVRTPPYRSPSTAVMTTNVTRFAMNVSKVLLERDPGKVTKARSQAAVDLTVMVGLTTGCGLGAACEAAVVSWSLTLPAGLALLAFAVAFAADFDAEGRS